MRNKAVKKHDAPAAHKRAIVPGNMRKRPIIRMNAASKQIKPPHSHVRSWHSRLSWKHPRPNTRCGRTHQQGLEQLKTRGFSNEST